MAKKECNVDIRCNVTSCAHHCDGQDYCSLRSIHVEACPNCSGGRPEDESMCGSYKPL